MALDARYFLFLLLCQSAFCEDCVTYNFEDDYDNQFTSDYGICVGMSPWEYNHYGTLDIDGPHNKSTAFIHPPEGMGCVSSFHFYIEDGGVIEVFVYMDESAQDSDYISVLIQTLTSDGGEGNVGNYVLTPINPDFLPGWTTITLRIATPRSVEAYIYLMGMAAHDSTVLVDSFRYIPPSFNEDMCKIYEDEDVTDAPTTVTDPPTTIIDVPITVTDPPTAITDAPTTVTDPPTTITDAPITVTDPPTAITDAPTTVTDPPTTITDAPTTVTDPPTTNTDAPTVTDPPTTITDAPTTVTDSPTTITDGPTSASTSTMATPGHSAVEIKIKIKVEIEI